MKSILCHGPQASDTELMQAYVELFDAARGFNPPWSELETATKGPEYKNMDISTAGSGLWFQIEKFKKAKRQTFQNGKSREQGEKGK